ncbi:MAG: hypothetical protein ACI8X5_002318 [Planctomycetota bacterium]|jgi:hypothetical protein
MRTRNLLLSLATVATIAGTWTAANAKAPGSSTSLRYEITVTNVTRGQILGPIAAASHGPGYSLFELGQPSSAGLAHMAEEGDPSMLLGEMTMHSEVFSAQTNGAVTMPGGSATVTIVADSDRSYLSLGGMLVSTNDGFIALRNIPAPTGTDTYLARVYDAGSEFNSEDCNYIPGPPCGAAGMHDPAMAEGYVRIHEGVHGVASLAAEEFDWRGEAVQVSIRRLNP